MTVDARGRARSGRLLVYLGVTHTDGAAEITWLARKVWELRILRDEGRRPTRTRRSWWSASSRSTATPARAGVRPGTPPPPATISEPAYDAFCAELERLGATVARGVFGGDMRVASVNDGPITVLLETP